MRCQADKILAEFSTPSRLYTRQSFRDFCAITEALFYGAGGKLPLRSTLRLWWSRRLTPTDCYRRYGKSYA